MVLAADQLKDLSFKPIISPTNAPSRNQEILHAEEALAAWRAFIEKSSVYSYIVHLRKVFNQLNIPKAVAKAVLKWDKMFSGELPQLENLYLDVLAKVQEDNFWKNMDQVAVNLCESRRDFLDQYLYSPLISLINKIVVGPPSLFNYGSGYESGIANSTTNSKVDAETYFGQVMPLVTSQLLEYLFGYEERFTREGFTCIGSRCRANGLGALRIAVHALVPGRWDKVFGQPYVGDNEETNLPQPRWALEANLDNAKYFSGTPSEMRLVWSSLDLPSTTQDSFLVGSYLSP